MTAHKKTKAGEPFSFLMSSFEAETDDCIHWPYALGGAGYGQLWISGKIRYSHVIICEMRHGPRPAKAEAEHLCGNKRCLNKRHLKWSSHKENCQRRAREHGVGVGDGHPSKKLTAKDVLFIRSNTLSNKELATKFGVDYRSIWAIRKRITWKHI